MAMSETLKKFLDAQQVAYKAQKHAAVYTAQEIAAAQHVPGRQLAKCVLVTTNAGPALAVLPAIQRVDLAKLKSLLKAARLRIAHEGDIKKAFPDVEVGAMSVFGNLYNVPVVVEKSLTDSAEIVCNAGTHTDTVAVSYRDVARLVRPKVGIFGMSLPGQAPKAKGAKKKSKKSGKKSRKKPAKKSAKSRTPAKKPARRSTR